MKNIDVIPVTGSGVYLGLNKGADILYDDLDTFSGRDNDRDQYSYQLQLYSTMHSQMFVQYNNNIVAPIKKRLNMERFWLTHGNNASLTGNRGVIALELYTIPKGTDGYDVACIDTIIKNNYVDLDPKSVNQLNKYLQDRLSKYETSVIRIATFISEDDIVRNSVVYEPKLNLVFGPNLINQPIMHPFAAKTHQRDSMLRVLNHAEPNILAVDINDRHNPGKSYYVKMGTKVSRLISTTDAVTPDGFSLTTKTNGVITTIQNGELSNMESAGIYDTHDQALHNGDATFAVTKLKADLEIHKIDSEYVKASMDIDKKKLDFEHLKKKQEHELVVMGTKGLADNVNNLVKAVLAIYTGIKK